MLTPGPYAPGPRGNTKIAEYNTKAAKAESGKPAVQSKARRAIAHAWFL